MHRLNCLLVFGLLISACQSKASPSKVLMSRATSAATDVTVEVHPAFVRMHVGEWFAFRATVSGATDPGVLWTVREPNGGTIESSGIYRGPSQSGTYHITAYSRAYPSQQVTAVVEVRPLVSITPGIFMGVTGETATFSGAVLGGKNQSVAWSIDNLIEGGSISVSGVYQAPQVPGLFSIRATSREFAKESTTAIVSIAATTPWGQRAAKPFRQIVSAPDGGFTVLGGFNELYHFDGNGEWTWGLKYSGTLYSLATTDSGYVLGGSTEERIAWLAAVDLLGNLVWQKMLGDGASISFVRSDTSGHGSWALHDIKNNRQSFSHYGADGQYIEGFSSNKIRTGYDSFIVNSNDEIVSSSYEEFDPIISKVSAIGVSLWSYRVTSETGRLVIAVSPMTTSRYLLYGYNQNTLQGWVGALDDLGNTAKLAWGFYLNTSQELCPVSGKYNFVSPMDAKTHGKSIFISGHMYCRLPDRDSGGQGGWFAELTTDGKPLWQRFLVYPNVFNSLPLYLQGVAVSPEGEPVFGGVDPYYGIIFKVSPGGYFPFNKNGDFHSINVGLKLGDSPTRLENAAISTLGSLTASVEVSGASIIPIPYSFRHSESLR